MQWLRWADGVLRDLPPAATMVGDQGKVVHDNKRLYRMGHKIETLFSRRKDWRPTTTRYDPCAPVFCSVILLAATVLSWL